MDEFDCLIIGAGVVGLAIAKDLSAKGLYVLVIEKNNTFGQETSSRNSEVVHGGMYYPSGSLKAQLCVEGRRMLYDFCNSNKVPHRKTGKMIVATSAQETSSLEDLLSLGKANGVEGLSIISKEETNKLEPQVRAVAALYSTETGIIDSHKFMSTLVELAKEKGAVFAYDCEFLKAEKSREGYKVSAENAGEIIEIEANMIINSAGLDSDIVAEKSGFDISANGYKLHYCKGQYFRLNSLKAKMLNMLVYPVPKPLSGGLGVHVTVDMAAGVRLGPDDEYLNSRVKEYSINPADRLKFYESVNKFIPFIGEEDLSIDTAGIRPKLQEKGGAFRDFVIADERGKGYPGFINLIGIESPGLTASLAISRYVREKVLRCF
jgi:L-2-hydroxyglutarate oxidase LhgO